ncbi:MAG TPA: DUF2510 domain-containing protein [Acidimicrobiales bacterium]
MTRATSATAQPTTTAAPAAAWYPDPTNPSQVRYWDGNAWTDNVAAAAGPSAAPPSAPAPPQWAPPRSAGPHGAYLGAIPATVGRKGRFDVVVYERALVFARVPGTDPASIGALLGLCTVGFVIGYVIGDHIGAGRDHARLAQLAHLPPEVVADAHGQNAIVPVSNVASCEIVTYGGVGGRLDLRTTGGKRYRRRWTRPHTRGNDFGALLVRPLGGVANVRRGSPIRPYVPIAAAIVLFALLLFALALPTFLSGRDRAESRNPEVTAVCQPYMAMFNSASEGTVPSREELTAVVSPMVDVFMRAAAEDQRYAPGRDAVVELNGMLSQPPEAVDQARAGAAAQRIAEACTP